MIVQNKAFTIVELLVVLGVVVLMISVRLPSFKGIQNMARTSLVEAELKTLQAAVTSYYLNSNPHAYPTSSASLGSSVLAAATPQVLRHALYDPFVAGNTTEYGYQLSGQYYVIYSKGPGGSGTVSTDSSSGVVTAANNAICVTNGTGCNVSATSSPRGGAAGGTGTDACGGCSGGRRCVSGACTDVSANNSACGTSLAVCSAGQSCINGTCCASGQTGCNGTSTNLSNDTQNCGACGTVCPNGMSCYAGICCSHSCGAKTCGDDTCGSTCGTGYCGPDVGCNSNADCSSIAPICSSQTFGCSTGGVGVPCSSAADCASGLYCVWNECTSDPQGADCFGATCPSGVPICRAFYWPMCSTGAPGVGCNSNADCLIAAPYCSNGVCTTDGAGSQCFSSANCPIGYICNTFSSCSSGKPGVGCFNNADCISPYTCSNSFFVCVVNGGTCSSNSDCASTTGAHICSSTTGTCSAGGAGAECSAPSDCVSGYCNGTCSAIAQGAMCTSSANCPIGYFCNSNGQCSTGGQGVGCSSSSDCSSAYPNCAWGIGCTANPLQASCSSPSDCPIGYPICNAYTGTCNTGGMGDNCDTGADCASPNTICSSWGCSAGLSGYGCNASTDCLSNNCSSNVCI
ncbi:MAG: hypothetical protein HQL12_00695 [Candidatus Omnitrophica bacterium]|nr:hypothetical protein [Candidatus Omnitrophota bacterium]